VNSPVADFVVADAGPLIGLARVGGLDVVRALFGRVLVPPAVYSELKVSSSRAGATALATAVGEGWLGQREITHVPARLIRSVDLGEAQAIALAKEAGALLLIDERAGRTAARREHVLIIGTGALLVGAKRRGVLPEVRPVLDALFQSGYRLSDALCREILSLAGER